LTIIEKTAIIDCFADLQREGEAAPQNAVDEAGVRCPRATPTSRQSSIPRARIRGAP
jgi:hypothetical protein